MEVTTVFFVQSPGVGSEAKEEWETPTFHLSQSIHKEQQAQEKVGNIYHLLAK